MDEIIVVKMSDLRAAKMCASGARKFCERHNIDWTDFLENGITSDKLIETGDAMASQLVEVARGRK